MEEDRPKYVLKSQERKDEYPSSKLELFCPHLNKIHAMLSSFVCVTYLQEKG